LNDDLHQGAVFQVSSNCFDYYWLVALSTIKSTISIGPVSRYFDEFHYISGISIFLIISYDFLQYTRLQTGTIF